MAKPEHHQAPPADEVPLAVERTRISFTWVAVAVAVVFLVFLIVFIAQNNRTVPVHFLWISGHVSEAVALVVAALAGAVLVLVAGAARVIQLRVAGRRHNRQVRKSQAEASAVPVAPPAETSAGTTPEGEPEPVQTNQ